MNYLIRILGGITLGVYTSVGLYYYSILTSRTKNAWLRILLFILCIAAFILTPMIGLGLMLNEAHPSTENLRITWVLALFFSWVSVVWAYLIWNWRTFHERLRAFKRVNKT